MLQLRADPTADPYRERMPNPGDDLTADLSRIDGSLVIARHSAFTYKGKQDHGHQPAPEPAE